MGGQPQQAGLNNLYPPAPSATLSPSASTLRRRRDDQRDRHSPPAPGAAQRAAFCQFSPARSPAKPGAHRQQRLFIEDQNRRGDSRGKGRQRHPAQGNAQRRKRRPAPDDDSSITPPNSSAAPQAAVSGLANATPPRLIPSADVATTASEAPALRPRICGSPSGLRITVCSSSPATAERHAGEQRRRETYQA
ncbi:Uncharacterised protein [Klebsiella michiganensis]|uniref:Uncharacterized protein n=1 Tax=Klebsiella michiganensis TaxID=1134687 RepID=A0A7H4PLB0_9ENTR|nr:Uncharacterised protein [Klebsiella michiganensis]